MKLDSKYFDAVRVRRPKAPTPEAEAPVCQWDGCREPGHHRAPVGRHAEGQYFRFCLDHVRQYNKGYNYFSGLSNDEIARYQREAITGHRPTWTISSGTGAGWRAAPMHSEMRSGSASTARMRDPFGLFGDGYGRDRQPQPRRRKLKTLEANAFETLGLPAHADRDAIKSRYKELVKRHHPDTNGGDRGSEERFRSVVQAYQLLRQAGFC